MDVPSTFEEFLLWLVSPAGAFLVVTWFASWALEKWAKWQALASTVKKAIMFGLALGLAALGAWLGSMPDLVATIEPYYQFLVAFIGGWLVLEVAHRVDKKTS